MGPILGKVIVPVPQNYSYVVEQLGRYHSTLQPGLNFLIPVLQKVRYQHSLKEQSFQINAQNAVTRDNVIMQIDGVLYMRVEDPVKCSYGARDPIAYTRVLAQSIMRAEIGKLTLDETFEEREKINENILGALKNAAEDWGLQCIRYEIKDIKVSDTIKKVMNLEAESERRKRAEVLISEGKKTAEINMAEAKRRSAVLHAQGTSEQILLSAEALAQRIALIRKAIESREGEVNASKAAQFHLAQQYLSALDSLADPSKNIVIKQNLSNPQQITDEALQLIEAAVAHDRQAASAASTVIDTKRA